MSDGSRSADFDFIFGGGSGRGWILFTTCHGPRILKKKLKITAPGPRSVVHDLTSHVSLQDDLRMSENPPILLEPQTEGEETSQARSILEVLTPGMREKVEAIPDALRSLPLDQLEQKANPSISQRRTKLKFWQEYQVVIEQNLHHLSPTKVFDGICSRQYFYRYVLDDPKVLAWFMVPAQKFDLVAEEALDFGIERLRSEILRAPLYNDAGKFDTAVANTLLQTVKFLDSRVHGSPLQRIENKNMNLHVHRTDGSVTREDLQRELEQIRLKLDGKGTTLALNAPEDPE